MITKEKFARMLDSTLLKPQATKEDIRKLCHEAKKFHFASVVVFPYWVNFASKEIAESSVKVCTVIGFPFGANETSVKTAETKLAIEHGAHEVDMVMNIGAFKSGDLEQATADISSVVDATKETSDSMNPTLVKVIIETCYLSKDEIKIAASLVVDCKADFVKTSTGFGPKGATLEDVKLLHETVGERIQIKAAGGIRTAKDAFDMIQAGASRIGTSSAVNLLTEFDLLKENRL